MERSAEGGTGRPPRRRGRTLRRVLTVVLAPVLILTSLLLVALRLGRSPRSDRDWASDQARLPVVTPAGDRIRVAGFRDFVHHPDGRVEERYGDGDFARGDIRGVWFALAPFADRWRGLAHSFVSFEFEGDRFLAVSVEARREADEGYSLLGGLLRGFEIAYVIGTERDLIGLRALRGDTLFLYPSRATPEQAWSLFRDMMERARETQAEPEFYHTLFNNCNTNLREHVNRATPAELPWGWGILLPGFSDALALEHGLLATDLPVDEARRRHRVDVRAREALDGSAAEAVAFGRYLRGG